MTDGVVVVVRVSEVPGQHGGEVVPVLDEDRAVKTERVVDLRRRLRRVVVAEDLTGRVARHDPDQEERHHRHTEQDRDHLQDPSTDVTPDVHRVVVSVSVSYGAGPPAGSAGLSPTEPAGLVLAKSQCWSTVREINESL